MKESLEESQSSEIPIQEHLEPDPAESTASITTNNDDQDEQYIGFDMIRIHYDKFPKKFSKNKVFHEAKAALKRHKIHMNRLAGGISLSFNMNYVLTDRSPLSRSNLYYSEVFNHVELLAQEYIPANIRIHNCTLSHIELHRTFSVERSAADYYNVIKKLNLQKSRRHAYRENGENSNSHYWVADKEAMVIYDKTAQMAYRSKFGRNLYRQMDQQLVRAEWRLRSKDLIQTKLGIKTPQDLLLQRQRLDTLYSEQWATLLPNIEFDHIELSTDAITRMDDEFKRLEGKVRNLSQEAFENLFIFGSIQRGDIDNFLARRKGSWETNKRLNDKARKLWLSCSEPQDNGNAKVYTELREYVIH